MLKYADTSCIIGLLKKYDLREEKWHITTISYQK